MAHLQLGHSKLFPGGTRLFVNPPGGVEKLVIHSGNRIALELVGWADSSGKPVISASVAGKVDVSEPKKIGGKWTFTVKATGAGETILTAADATGGAATSGLRLFAGTFENHNLWKYDLIADVYRGSDSAKMHALTRLLHN